MVIMTQDERFITIKIPESVHKNLTQYRDDNRLKSIGIAVQDGLDCLDLHKEIECEYDIIQDGWAGLYDLNAIYWVKYLNSLNQDELTNHLNEYCSGFCVEIESAIKNPAFNSIKNKYELYCGLMNYIETTLDTTKKSDCSQEIISKVSEMFLNSLINSRLLSTLDDME